MQAKDYLSQAFRLDQKINRKLEQVATLKEMATKATASIHAARVSGTRQRSPMEDAVIRLVDLEYEINVDIDKLVDVKRELTEVISKLEIHAYRTVLQLRYLGGNTWGAVSAIMGYDLTWIYHLHGKALQEVELQLISMPVKAILRKL